MRPVSSVVWAVARRPGYWLVALRVARRMTPRGWWRRAPFLPVPSADYVRFRLETQYGDAAGADVASRAATDVLKYLSWVNHWDAAS